ncbi:T9SS type A sorting domain-containing protein [Mucilaginibacter sp. L196]|uniref:T9SS type A sorting domain-containing protein n=1 Tax=Mucilaginibacter sp. L196 TaxID=1641870 RepID=UPI00131D50D3|nr:T9SS type A sorting domain-containing protein [Mucilaginibacter sp. L196]
MRRIYTKYYSWKICIAMAVFMNFALAYGRPVIKDTIYLHSKKVKAKQSYLKNGLPFSLPPVKPGVTSYVKFTVNHQDDKLLSDVEVYPNPATDQINLKYVVSRNTNVSIKIMDVLGNDLLNVFQQRVDLGEQKFSYSISNKLSRGFYFVKIVAGTESVIKRISIL